MSAVVIREKIVHYEVLGRGPPIIFLHGWLGSWRYWVPSMQTMSARYRTYALDLWGFGDTSNSPERYALQEQIELLKALLDYLGVARAALVGHALGGVIAIRFAARYPDYVARVMAISTPLAAITVNPRFANTSTEGLVDWLVGGGAAGNAIAAEAGKTDRPVIETTLGDLQAIDLRTDLAEINAPCLLVHGERDPAIAAPQDEWLIGINSSSFHRINFEEARHFPMLENQPQFDRLLLDFLEAGDDLASLRLKEEWKRRMR